MKTSDFDYYLPKNLIAQQPLKSRDRSRLLVLERAGGVEHSTFSRIGRYLRAGDLLVMNNTRVIPARLHGIKPTGGHVEILLLNPVNDGTWNCLVKPARRVSLGTLVNFDQELQAEVVASGEEGVRQLRFSLTGNDFDRKLEQLGQVPLPPYIENELDDSERYQTVYATSPGAVAAPTAGLHFTPQLLSDLEAVGIKRTELTLHVGLGTFRPVAVENIQEHKMHSEFYQLGSEAAAAINRTRSEGGRIVAVGTTAVRVLESVATPDGSVEPGQGWTDIFIYPGFKFRVVDALITNFHLPQSTLLMLVSALAGRERILEAYQEAVAAEYRFFSFGDAMLII
ncbi:MAG: tRNA preQ1(34) S-adenosylmethionine ribosyltransferase-isomerase QueA [Firmicutes bacterium]|nr:tRNA preQ1(34) S-adenosylmethionine ribosyltransferase-isomerase QueA [Bacillota bacterium]